MIKQNFNHFKNNGSSVMFSLMMLFSSWSFGVEPFGNARESNRLEQIKMHRDNPEKLVELLPIVKCSFNPSQYERILMTRLRDKKTLTNDFRDASQKIGALLVNKVIECCPTLSIPIETPLTSFTGEILAKNIELVSIMRSGDALMDAFVTHFPEANVSKILIQRDEETAKPHFKYMKLSPTIDRNNPVVIAEPMVATGGTLDMVISLLKEKGVQEENIIIASICTCPEGLSLLCDKYPKIKIVLTIMDEELNDKMYIIPGLGDFGDRYFGTAISN